MPLSAILTITNLALPQIMQLVQTIKNQGGDVTVHLDAAELQTNENIKQMQDFLASLKG